MLTKTKGLFGICFDGVSVSGITVEFFKIAKIFHKSGYKIFFDLGYEIKADKNNFFKPYTNEQQVIPPEIELTRIEGMDKIEGYNEQFVMEVLERVVRWADPDIELHAKMANMEAQICECILNTWRTNNISFVIVENGTLPENIIFTNALYRAIEIYGEESQLGKFVFWRDHDLMWWSEPGKYGQPPYLYTPKPKNTVHIQYVVLHELACQLLKDWSHINNIQVLPNTYRFEPARIQERNINFRKDFHIPEDAFLIARCTRIIAQKRIDRDIYLVYELQRLLDTRKSDKKVYLFISGSTKEDPEETDKLANLAMKLGIKNQIVFGGELLPFNEDKQQNGFYSIKDLLAHSQLNSFLTSYDYEGYGNPPGESIASQVPYITTDYEIYQHIYGKLGFKAIILPITMINDGFPTESFVHEVLDFLLDKRKQQEFARFNYSLGEKHFSSEFIESEIERLFFKIIERGGRVNVGS